MSSSCSCSDNSHWRSLKTHGLAFYVPNFGLTIGLAIFATLIPVSLKEMGESKAMTGLVVALPGIGRLLADIPTSFLSHHASIGPFFVLVLSSILSAAIFSLPTIEYKLWAFFVSQSLGGIPGAMFATARLEMWAACLQKMERNILTNHMGAGARFSYVVGPILGGVLYSHVGPVYGYASSVCFFGVCIIGVVAAWPALKGMSDKMLQARLDAQRKLEEIKRIVERRDERRRRKMMLMASAEGGGGAAASGGDSKSNSASRSRSAPKEEEEKNSGDEGEVARCDDHASVTSFDPTEVSGSSGSSTTSSSDDDADDSKRRLVNAHSVTPPSAAHNNLTIRTSGGTPPMSVPRISIVSSPVQTTQSLVFSSNFDTPNATALLLPKPRRSCGADDGNNDGHQDEDGDDRGNLRTTYGSLGDAGNTNIVNADDEPPPVAPRDAQQQQQHHHHHHHHHASVCEALSTHWRVVVAVGLLALSVTALRAGRRLALQFRALDLGLDAKEMGYVLALSFSIDTFFFFVTSVVSNRYGYRAAVVPLLFMYAAAFVVLSFDSATNNTTLLLSAVIFGIGDTFGAGLMLAIAGELCPRPTIGAVRAFVDAGVLLGPLVTGALCHGMEFGWAMRILAWWSFISLVASFVVLPAGVGKSEAPLSEEEERKRRLEALLKEQEERQQRQV